MSNPESSDFSRLAGYLKVSVNITGPKDEKVVLIEDPKSRITINSDKVWMPPFVKKQYKQLCIQIIRGEKLTEVDAYGTIDAYVRYEDGRRILETPDIKMSSSTK